MVAPSYQPFVNPDFQWPGRTKDALVDAKGNPPKETKLPYSRSRKKGSLDPGEEPQLHLMSHYFPIVNLVSVTHVSLFATQDGREL